MTRTRLLAAALVTALVPAGCSHQPPPIVAVEGVVTLNGRPVPKAEVQFVPMAPGLGGEFIAVAVTDDDGRFKLVCNGQPGACAGENRVVVAEGPLPDDARGQSGAAQARASRYLAGLKNRPLPGKYATAAQSPLAVTVTADRTTYDLDLSR